MKSVKILIAALILASTFNACKKDEITSQPGEVGLSSKGSNKNVEAVVADEVAADAATTVVFDIEGNVTVKGNIGLEKLIGSEEAIANANAAVRDIFSLSGSNQLSIAFDKAGNTISSDIPKVPVGSTMSNLVIDVCGLSSVEEMKVTITKSEIIRNHMEYWNAIPAGNLQSFYDVAAQVQNDLPEGHSFTVEFATGQEPRITMTDENGVQELVTVWGTGCTFDPYNFLAWGYAWHCATTQYFTFY
ncbi:MAG: hypothetical protein ACK46S_03180 [Bacteroidota bacterium]|jgi:hypothetical protein